MTETIQDRVALGAALLDANLPGWDERIDLDRLNLASGCNCILGQEFGGRGELINGFTVGLYRFFGGDGFAAARFGFTTDNEGFERFGDLTAEWKRVILARRGGAS